ncbi:MAG: M15 family metallopeptidase [Candidatus Pacebacteria bacterium]|nr:M15 family metallopeptidase [Candidatus Paceibacterota bacterium]
MEEQKKRPLTYFLPFIALWTIPVLVIVLGYFIYDGYQYKKEQAVHYIALEEKFEAQLLLQSQLLASSTKALSDSIGIIEENLSLTKSESLALSNALEDALNAEKQKLASLQKETANLGGAVGDLEKLSEIDSELLMKYSKVFFLNEHYVPSSLSEILNKYLYSERETKYFHTGALPHLTQMIDDALTQGKVLYVRSAYRSFNEQDNLKSHYTVTYGENTANTFSADQGYSEHQLGTAVDLITTGFEGILTEDFDTTDEYVWLKNNAHNYGFTLSYPKTNGYYVYEPWHWRFVGVALATKLHNENINFYDMDQRIIDEYLISIFD